MKTDPKTAAKTGGTETKAVAAKTTKPMPENAASAEQAAKVKSDLRKELEAKPLMNLESTLQVLENLQTRMLQRNRLLYTIDNLETFEIDLNKEVDDLGGTHFQGCTLTIKDDKRNEFTTGNPVVIAAVAEFVKDMCTRRLSEIEATIVLP